MPHLGGHLSTLVRGLGVEAQLGGEAALCGQKACSGGAWVLVTAGRGSACACQLPSLVSHQMSQVLHARIARMFV